MFPVTLENGLPTLPEGYRWLINGEALQEGDRWADVEFGSWEPCLSWKRGAIKQEGGMNYIRKLEMVPAEQ